GQGTHKGCPYDPSASDLNRYEDFHNLTTGEPGFIILPSTAQSLPVAIYRHIAGEQVQSNKHDHSIFMRLELVCFRLPGGRGGKV
ncbi:MAG: hypothetical protein WCD37_04720, partial [Chloroflexia bacterium]